ncbi:hypothetical protein EMIT0196MI5_30348 [Pseudomonas sp. IT-196MI5]
MRRSRIHREQARSYKKRVVDNSALLDLLRPLPAVDVFLASTSDGQLGFIHSRGDGRTGRCRCTGEDIHRRHQRVVGTDEHIFAQHGFPLVGAIVVAGDGASTDVGARAHLGIAQIRQVTGLGAFAQVSVFQLDEVTHMRAGFQHGAWTQTGERAGIAAFTQNGTLDMAVGLDDHAFAQGAVLDHAVRADHHIVFDDDLAFEDHVDIDQHVAANGDFAAHIETCRVAQGHTLGHQTTAGAQLIVTFEFGKLLAVVGALHFHGVVGLFGGHYQTIVDRHFDHVSQVILTLNIIVRQAARPVGQAIGRNSEDTGVAFADRALRFVGILVFNDGSDFTVNVAHDAAITGRIVEFYSQQAHLSWHYLSQQALQGFHFNQRHVTVKNQHGVGFDEGNCLGHGVAGSQLFVLQDEVQVVSGQTFAHGVGTMTYHDVDALWIKLPGAVDNMAEHRIAGNRVQDFRQGGTHARALASSENNDFKGHDWLPIQGGQRLRPRL